MIVKVEEDGLTQNKCFINCRMVLYDIFIFGVHTSSMLSNNVSIIFVYNSTVANELLSTSFMTLSDHVDRRGCNKSITLILQPIEQRSCPQFPSASQSKGKPITHIPVFTEYGGMDAQILFQDDMLTAIHDFSEEVFNGRNFSMKYSTYSKEAFHGTVMYTMDDQLTQCTSPSPMQFASKRAVIRSLQHRNDSREIYVVGTLTTSAARLFATSDGLTKCLLNLLSLTALHRIYLNIPWSYGIRQKTKAIDVPERLVALANRTNGRLRILRCEDYGPATKLLPLLNLPVDELPMDSILITFDDDRMYTVNGVESLVRHSLAKPDTAITIAAWSISILSAHGIRGKRNGPTFHSQIRPPKVEGQQFKTAGYVDLVLGFYGVAYRKYFFANHSELFDYGAHPHFSANCAWVDDIWFSGHLERLGIPKFTIGNVEDSRADITDLNHVGALSKDHGESVKQNHDNVICAESMREVWGIWGNQQRNIPNQPAKLRHKVTYPST